MFEIKSTHDQVPDESYDDKDLAELEMRILVENYSTQLKCEFVHLPWCSVIFNSADEWRMMWVSRLNSDSM